MMGRTVWTYLLSFFIPFFCNAQFASTLKREKDLLMQYDSLEYNDIGQITSGDKIKRILHAAKQFNFEAGVLRGLILLQRNALRQGDYVLSENYGNEAEQLAHKQANEYALSLIHVNRVAATMGLGFYSEAKEMLKSATFRDKIKNKVDRNLYLSNKNMLLAGVFSHQDSNDSVLYYTKKSLEFVESIPTNDLSEYQKIRYYYLRIFQLMNMGITYTYKCNPPKLNLAETYFQNALQFSNTHPQYFKLCDIEVYESVSAFYLTKGDYNKCIEFSKKVLQHEKIKNKPEERLDAYSELKDAYKALGNSAEELKYLRLYTILSDSLTKAQKKNAIDLSRKKIVELKEKTKTTYSNRNMAIVAIAILFSLSAVTGVSYYTTKKQRRYRKNYDQLIEGLQIPQERSYEATNEEKAGSLKKIIISENAQKKLLKKLETFERTEKFLRKEMTLTSLSNLLGTNPKYLSEVIKNHRAQNFNSYINSLKINFIVQKLYNEPEYRAYKISYLAEKCGYASPQVFVIAFKKERGVTPSYFISQLKTGSDD
ncbi:helix-turn-helix domain-containing protein [Sphingobacterium multivorum]|uniref:helix-turn-helix domain-containing protein n=1 Tax=Sphingobacterium multivorum TaxID=28454 RepID=UPI0031BBA622